jgi:hypothetical protein
MFARTSSEVVTIVCVAGERSLASDETLEVRRRVPCAGLIDDALDPVVEVGFLGMVLHTRSAAVRQRDSGCDVQDLIILELACQDASAPPPHARPDDCGSGTG